MPIYQFFSPIYFSMVAEYKKKTVLSCVGLTGARGYAPCKSGRDFRASIQHIKTTEIHFGVVALAFNKKKHEICI